MKPLESGKMKRLKGDLTRLARALEVERQVMEAEIQKFRTQAEAAQYDALVEGCAGAAMTSQRAALFGQRAIQPADVMYGWSLTTEQGRRLWKRNTTERKPLLVIAGFPCMYRTPYNIHINYRQMPELLKELQDSERPLL